MSVDFPSGNPHSPQSTLPKKEAVLNLAKLFKGWQLAISPPGELGPWTLDAAGNYFSIKTDPVTGIQSNEPVAGGLVANDPDAIRAIFKAFELLGSVAAQVDEFNPMILKTDSTPGGFIKRQADPMQGVKSAVRENLKFYNSVVAQKAVDNKPGL